MRVGTFSQSSVRPGKMSNQGACTTLTTPHHARQCDLACKMHAMYFVFEATVSYTAIQTTETARIETAALLQGPPYPNEVPALAAICGCFSPLDAAGAETFAKLLLGKPRDQIMCKMCGAAEYLMGNGPDPDVWS